MADFDLDLSGPGARIALAAAKRAEAAVSGISTAIPDITAAKDAALTDIGDAQTTAVSEVQTEGATQVALATEQVTLATAAALTVQPLAIYTTDMRGAGEDVVPFVRELTSASAASALYGISGGFDASVDANRPITGIQVNLALGADSSGTAAQSFKLFIVKKLLTDSDLNTASPETWTAVQQVVFDADAVSSLGVGIGAPSATNLRSVLLNLTTAVTRGDGYALGWYILAYTGTDGTGNECNVYRGLTTTTGDAAYIRGFTQNAAGAWSVRADGSGHAFAVHASGAYSTSDIEGRLETVENLSNKTAVSLSSTSTANYSFAGATVVGATGNFGEFKIIREIPVGEQVTSVEIPAALNTNAASVVLKIYRRDSDDTFLTTYPNVTMRKRVLLATVTMTTAETGLTAGGDAGTIVFDTSALGIWGLSDKLLEFGWTSYDSSGAQILASGTGMGFRYTTGAASPNYTGGWFKSYTGTATAAQIAITIKTSKYVSAGSSSTAPNARRIVKALSTSSISGNVLTLAGTLADAVGTETSFSGTLTETLPSAYRYDAILVDPTSGALSRVAGTEQSSGWLAALSPGKPTGSAIQLGLLACSPTAPYYFVPTWDVAGPVRRSGLASHLEERIRVQKALYPWLRTLIPGATTTVCYIGDSRTRIASSGTPDSYTPNTAYRDLANSYLAALTSDLLTAALADYETFSRDGVTHYYFGPWAELTKRLRDMGVTVNDYNLGNNSTTTSMLADTSYQAAIQSINPDYLNIAFGMNDLNTIKNVTTYLDALNTFLTWAAANLTNLKGVTIEATPRPNASGYADGANLASWTAYQEAVQTAVTTWNTRSGITRLSPRAVALTYLPGFDENCGLTGVAPVDRMTCNGGNHDGPPEKNWITANMQSLLFGDI